MKKKFFRTLICVALVAVVIASCLSFYGCKKSYNSYKYVKDGKTDISIGVLADIHVMAETQAVDMTCADYKAWEAHGQKMLGLSESLLKTAVDRIIKESDFKVVLVSGDNSDDGGEISHRAVAAQLKRLEDAGIAVFTIPGNHDLNNKSCTYASGSAVLTNPTTEAEFAEIYKDFGYNAKDSLEFYKHEGATAEERKSDSFAIGENLSYVADLSDKYRLIAIDMCNYVANDFVRDTDGSYAAAGYEVDSEGYVLVDGERYPCVSGYLWDKDGSYAAAGYEVDKQGYVLDEDGDRISVPGRHDGAMTEDLLLWAEAKTKEAIAAGKIPLGMMHFPLVQHFGSLVDAANGAVNDPEGYVVADVLADAGMRYIFTGHIHIQDDALYTTKQGNKILDINSASLCNYPTPVRYFRAKGDEIYVRTWNMDRIEQKYLPSYLSAAERKAIKKDFRAYSVDYIDESMLAKVKNKVDMDMMYTLLKKFGIKVKEDQSNKKEVDALAQSLYEDVFLKFLKMPLYKKNAEKGETSVESLVKSYGLKMPSSDYTSVFDLAMSYVVGVYGGDEKASLKENRATLLKYSIYSAFWVIADYDLFGKLHALNPKVQEISLKDSMEDLFKYGKLDVCENGLLICILTSLDVSIFRKYLTFDASSDPYRVLNSVQKVLNTSAVKEMLFGIDLASYLQVNASAKVGCIDLGAAYDDLLFGELTLGLMNDAIEGKSVYSYRDGKTDNAPADNNLKINTKSMAYSALK